MLDLVEKSLIKASHVCNLNPHGFNFVTFPTCES